MTARSGDRLAWGASGGVAATAGLFSIAELISASVAEAMK
jgi:hypothetical protein